MSNRNRLLRTTVIATVVLGLSACGGQSAPSSTPTSAPAPTFDCRTYNSCETGSAPAPQVTTETVDPEPTSTLDPAGANCWEAYFWDDLNEQVAEPYSVLVESDLNGERVRMPATDRTHRLILDGAWLLIGYCDAEPNS